MSVAPCPRPCPARVLIALAAGVLAWTLPRDARASPGDGSGLGSVLVEGTGTSSLSAALEGMIAEELGPRAEAPAPLLRVTLEGKAGALRIVARRASGAVVLEREVETTRGPSPALRIAALLVREVFDAELRAEAGGAALPAAAGRRAPEASPAEGAAEGGGPGSWVLRLAPSLGALSSLRDPWPATLSLGVTAELRGASAVYAVAQVLAEGHLCCTRETADVALDAQVYRALGGGGLVVLEGGAAALAVELAGGVEVTLGRATAKVFAAPSTPAEVHHTRAVLMAAAALGVELPAPLSLRVRAGLLAGAPSRVIGVPDVFPRVGGAPPEPLELGAVALFLALGLGVELEP